MVHVPGAMALTSLDWLVSIQQLRNGHFFSYEQLMSLVLAVALSRIARSGASGNDAYSA